jgi:hypothetical protein
VAVAVPMLVGARVVQCPHHDEEQDPSLCDVEAHPEVPLVDPARPDQRTAVGFGKLAFVIAAVRPTFEYTMAMRLYHDAVLYNDPVWEGRYVGKPVRIVGCVLRCGPQSVQRHLIRKGAAVVIPREHQVSVHIAGDDGGIE